MKPQVDQLELIDKIKLKSIADKRRRLEHPQFYMLRNAQQRASRKNFEFELDSLWLEEKWNKGICEATGLSFEYEFGIRNPWMPSIDRIESSKGYTKENSQLVCWMYNACKSTFTSADVLIMAKAVLDANNAKRGDCG
jgi:hypothetical protein